MTERGWVAELRVPWSAFDMHEPPPAGSEWRINVGRYNITSSAPFDSQAFQMAGGGERELSASAPLTVGSFHNYEEFNTLVSHWLPAQNYGVGENPVVYSHAENGSMLSHRCSDRQIQHGRPSPLPELASSPTRTIYWPSFNSVVVIK